MSKEQKEFGYSKDKQLHKVDAQENPKCRVAGCFIKSIKGSKYCKGHTEQITGKKSSSGYVSKYKKNRGKPKKKSDYAKAENTTWVIFSRVIRLRDTNANGYGYCIASNREIYYLVKDGKTYSNCDAGHFHTRAIKSLIFDFNNVAAQSRKSNRFEGEKKGIFKFNLTRKIGVEEMLRMEHDAFNWGTGLEKTRPTIEWMKGFRKYLIECEKVLLKTKNWY